MKGEWIKWIKRWQPSHRGCLRARVNRPDESKDPCLTSPDAQYRGQENQLYRVEIHQGSSDKNGPTFKWSRDNGAIVSRVVENRGIELVVENPRGFVAGNWVELSNDGQELWGLPGQLVKLLKVEGDHFTLESEVSTPAALPENEVWPTKVRRWDQHKNGKNELKEGAVPVTEGQEETTWIELENGIQIQFQPANQDDGNSYRTGDYWLIPARVATGGIEWPVELDGESKPLAPFGIQHHYAPLAILKPGENPENRRNKFPTGSKIQSHGEEGRGGHPQCELPASPS